MTKNVLVRLTATQIRWLIRAREAGYETGFRARWNPALGRLMKLGYVERDPSSPTHWRVTWSGIAVRLNTESCLTGKSLNDPDPQRPNRSPVPGVSS